MLQMKTASLNHHQAYVRLILSDWFLKCVYSLKYKGSTLVVVSVAVDNNSSTGSAGPHATLGRLILKSILGWTQSAADTSCPGNNNPFPAAPCRLSAWTAYVRRCYLVVDVH